MRIVVDAETGPQVFALSPGLLADFSAGADRPTVADLLDALGVTVGSDCVTLDGVRMNCTDRLDELPLRPGSRISPIGGEARARATLGSIDVVSGLDAGIRHALQPGRYLIGRSPMADVVVGSPTVSRRHARLEVEADGALTIANIGSFNGVRVGERKIDGPEPLNWGEVVRLGSATIRVRCSPPDAPQHLASQRRASHLRVPESHVPGVSQAAASGLLTFNRMPRRDFPSPPTPLDLPVRRLPEHYRPRFSWAAIIAPLILGVVMAMLWNPFYALFMILSPVMTVMNWWEDKHRLRRETKQIERHFARDLERFEAELQTQILAERQRRQGRHIDLAELQRRAAAPSVHLWERRSDHADFLEVVVGLGHVRLDAAVTTTSTDGEGDNPTETEVAAVLNRAGMLRDVPIDITLGVGTVTGITGRRHVAQSVARGLVGSIVSNHGPADVEVVVLCSPDQTREWEWVSLLPHVTDRYSALSRPLVATTIEEATNLVGRQLGLLTNRPGQTVASLIIVDGPEFHEGRHAAVRRLAGIEGCALLVVADSVDWLPAQTSTVIETAGDDGVGRLIDPSLLRQPVEVVLDGMSCSTSWDLSSALARFEDPEMMSSGTAIPAEVSLVSLLGGSIEPAAIARRWTAFRNTTGLPTPIGSDEHGPVIVDLVADGPHALVGGTTGSGKSELLRSMVAAMAATSDADHLGFVLIDYKGGSAFDRCANLPHTVGVVTDLDPHLSERALRCLNAELEYRERLLRSAGADSIESYRSRRTAGSGLEPLPRLVVVIDEFATLVNELPEFVDSLVGIAQRGRSLGVHLVLATQRPSGAINDNIRTNTNLRIALRMLDSVDSIDVIGSDAAAAIGRDAPGRACLRLGPGQLVNFQSALSTGSGDAANAPLVSPVLFGSIPNGFENRTAEADDPSSFDGLTNLDKLVASIREVHERLGVEAPRCPWPSPLADNLTLAEIEQLGEANLANSVLGETVFGEMDDPDNQQKIAATWNPLAGNSFVAGAAQSGVTTALRTMVVAACGTLRPDELHVYVLDLGRGEYGDLVDMAHVGAVVGPAETERQQRLLHILAREVRRRKADPSATALPTLLVVDGLDTFRRENDDRYELLELLDTIYLDGPSIGITTLVSAASPNELRHFAATTRFRLYLRTSDAMDVREIGFRGAVDPDPPSGRGHLAPHGLEVQVAVAEASDVAMAANQPLSAFPPLRVGVLESDLSASLLCPAASLENGRLWIPLGVRGTDLETAGFTLESGQHALIAGPSRSGKTTALRTVEELLSEAGTCQVHWFGDLGPDGLAQLSSQAEPVVVLLDDVEAIEDHGALAEVLANRDGVVHLIAAGRVDRLRTAYGHWTNEFKQMRRGVLLWPDILDGDVLGIDLPNRTTTAAIPGRGVLIQDGTCDVVQIAAPEEG